jgi:hypothetical protein
MLSLLLLSPDDVQNSPAGEAFGLEAPCKTMDHLAQYMMLTPDQLEMGRSAVN